MKYLLLLQETGNRWEFWDYGSKQKHFIEWSKDEIAEKISVIVFWGLMLSHKTVHACKKAAVKCSISQIVGSIEILIIL